MRHALTLLLCLAVLAGLLTGCENLPDYLTPPDSAVQEPFGPTVSQAPDGPAETVPIEDVPVAALLHAEFAHREDNSVYGELLLDKSVQNKDIWLGKVEKVFAALVEAEALPADLWEQVVPYTWQDSVHFTVIVDSMGSESINCNLTSSTRPPHYLHCTVEAADGIALSARASLPLGYPLTEAERDTLLQNFLAYQGLDVFGDWEKEVYTPGDGDLPSADYSGYLTVYNSESANLSAALTWQAEEDDYLMFSFTVQVGVNHLA